MAKKGAALIRDLAKRLRGGETIDIWTRKAGKRGSGYYFRAGQWTGVSHLKTPEGAAGALVRDLLGRSTVAEIRAALPPPQASPFKAGDWVKARWKKSPQYGNALRVKRVRFSSGMDSWLVTVALPGGRAGVSDEAVFGAKALRKSRQPKTGSTGRGRRSPAGWKHPEAGAYIRTYSDGAVYRVSRGRGGWRAVYNGPRGGRGAIGRTGALEPTHYTHPTARVGKQAADKHRRARKS